MAYREFYNGFISQNEAETAKSAGEEQIALEKAIKHCTNALELNLQLPGIYNNRGNVYNDFNEHELAIVDFNAAIDLKPDYAEAYLQSRECFQEHRRT